MEVIEQHRIEIVHLAQQLQRSKANVGVRCGAASHSEEMPPLAGIHRYHNLSLGALRQDRTSLLRLGANFKQSQIMLVGVLHGLQPDFQLNPVAIAHLAVPEGRLTDSDATAELFVAVVAIPGGLLTVGGDTVPHNLVGYATVDDEPRRDSAVLENALVAALDDAGDKLVGRTIADFTLRLIAGTPGAFNLTQQVFRGRAILNVGVHRDYLYHYSSPPCSVSNCPA